MRYLKPSIHSDSACEPRPSAASIAALYPRIAWSLDTTPLVREFSARSVRKPATAPGNLPMSTQMSARCFAQVSCSHGSSWVHVGRMPCGTGARVWAWP
jgi:hypothetical protein